MGKIKFLGILLAVLSCGPSPTKIWLHEYEALLKEAVQVIASDSSSSHAERMRVRIAEKEAEINEILRSSSMQEQMSFLSDYYDMRVRFFYALQDN